MIQGPLLVRKRVVTSSCRVRHVRRAVEMSWAIPVGSAASVSHAETRYAAKAGGVPRVLAWRELPLTPSGSRFQR